MELRIFRIKIAQLFTKGLSPTLSYDKNTAQVPLVQLDRTRTS